MNSNIPAIYAEAIENDEPITTDGFTLYPIQLRQHRAFSAAKSSLLLRQGSLPVEYAVMNYLSALYAMDLDAYTEHKEAYGFIAGALTMLALAMRFPADAMLRQTTVKVSERDPRTLAYMEIRAGEQILRLTPTTFDRLRRIIAAQNGLELPDETENVDLVEAEADIAASRAAGVEIDFDTLIASVARDQRCRRADLMDYTIREFYALKDAIERDKLFTIYKTAEISGAVKFSKGNPCPSWCYDRREKAGSMISMADFMAGPGSVATMK